MLYTNCHMLQQKHLIFVGLHHTSIIRLSLPRPRAPFASRPLRRSQLPPSAKSSQDLSQMVDEAMGKWGISQWMNKQMMDEPMENPKSPSNLRVKKGPFFWPFSCISDTSCNGRAPPERVSVPVPAAPPTHCWRLGWSCSACPGLQPIWAAGRPRLGRYQLTAGYCVF